MKQIILASSTALMCLVSAAAAQSVVFDGAELSFTNFDNRDADNAQHRRASAEVSFAGFAAQMDLDAFAANGTNRFSSYTLHLNSEIRDGMRLGAFYGREDWKGFDYEFAGLETQNTFGLSTIETALGRGTGLNNGFDFVFMDIDIEYDLGGGFTALGNYVSASGSETVDIYGFGVRYTYSAFFAEATLDQFSGDTDQEVLGLEVGYIFGAGTTFDSRDWSGVIGMYN